MPTLGRSSGFTVERTVPNFGNDVVDQRDRSVLLKVVAAYAYLTSSSVTYRVNRRFTYRKLLK